MNKVFLNICKSIELLRVNNLFLLAFNLIFAYYFFVSKIFDSTIFLIITSILFITAGGYIINDYYDIEIDKINKPNKKTIGHFISKREVLVLYFLINIVGLSIISKVSILLLLIFSGVIILLWFYSFSFKKEAIIGNITVAILASIPLIIIQLYYLPPSNYLFIYAFFAFGITLIREIVKDIEDIKGDQLMKCKTLPIRIGVPKTIIILNFISVAYFIFIFYLFNQILKVDLLLITLFSIAFFVFIILLNDNKSGPNYHLISNLLKLIMFLGIITIPFVK